jgi:hypothetical protein
VPRGELSSVVIRDKTCQADSSGRRTVRTPVLRYLVMRAFRRHIGTLAAVWFLFQAGALAATPVAALELSLSEDARLPECCRNLQPGQACPMHPHPEAAAVAPAGDVHACHCSPISSPLDRALLSLAAGLGLTVPVVSLSATTAPPSRLDVPTPQPRSQAARLDTPPPRS